MWTKALPPEKKWTKSAMSPQDKPAVAKLLSPCISVCQMDALDDLCVGCFRTRTEIATWGSMDQEDQIRLLDVLSDRRVEAKGILRGISRSHKNF